jgi:hypothetical protein
MDFARGDDAAEFSSTFRSTKIFSIWPSVGLLDQIAAEARKIESF